MKIVDHLIIRCIRIVYSSNDNRNKLNNYIVIIQLKNRAKIENATASKKDDLFSNIA
jgi:hypothetical protein